MDYLKDHSYQSACGLLMKAACESVQLMEERHYRRAELTLRIALEEVDDILYGNPFKAGGCRS